MSPAFFPSINNRMDRSVPKFGARCTITRPTFPLGTGLGVGLGLPKSLGNACASLAVTTKIAQATVTPTNALGNKFIAPNLSRYPLFPLSNSAFPVRTLLSLESAMSVSALRILAVDNEPSVTFSLRYIFTAPRYEVSAVENGDAALARLDSGSGPYDIIIV